MKRILFVILITWPALTFAQVVYQTDGKDVYRCEVVAPEKVDIEAIRVRENDIKEQIGKLQSEITIKEKELDTMKKPTVIESTEVGIGTVPKAKGGSL